MKDFTEMIEAVQNDTIARDQVFYRNLFYDALNRLVEYGLVQEAGRMDAPGRPILFGTTEDFLRNFGVRSTEELPSIQPELAEEMKSEAEEEVQLKLNL